MPKKKFPIKPKKKWEKVSLEIIREALKYGLLNMQMVYHDLDYWRDVNPEFIGLLLSEMIKDLNEMVEESDEEESY